MSDMSDALSYAFSAARITDIYRPPLPALNVTVPALYQLKQSTGDIYSDEMTIELRVTRGGRTYCGEAKLIGKLTQPYTREIPLHEIMEIRI